MIKQAIDSAAGSIDSSMAIDNTQTTGSTDAPHAVSNLDPARTWFADACILGIGNALPVSTASNSHTDIVHRYNLQTPGGQS